MLYTNKLNTKAQALGIRSGVIIILALLFLAFMIFGPFKQSAQASEKLTAMSPNTDSLCISQTPFIQGRDIIDIDGDLRDDLLCDSCVCKVGCNNNPTRAGGNDKDLDALPDKCDKNPDKKEKNPEFNEKVCPKDDANKVIFLGSTYGYQCNP